MPVLSGGQVVDAALKRVRVYTVAGAPTDGTSGTGAGEADPGQLLVDTTNGDVYTNSNTKASPTWILLSDAGVLLPATTAGRAKMADDFFGSASVVTAKFAAQSIPWTEIGLRTVEAHTAGDTLTTAESGSVHTNAGASGAIVLALPAAVVGLEYFFAVEAAQELRIDPNGTETIALPSTGVQSAAGKYIVADAVSETVHLMCCLAGTWQVFGFTGTWTAEA